MQENKLKSLKVEEGWRMNEEWMKSDEGWLKDDDEEDFCCDEDT